MEGELYILSSITILISAIIYEVILRGYFIQNSKILSPKFSNMWPNIAKQVLKLLLVDNFVNFETVSFFFLE